MLRSPTRRFFAVTALVTATLAISCGSDITGPSHGGVRYARGISFQPVFSGLAAQAADAGLVPFTTVHIVLHHADGSIALDTIVNFPADATELTLSLDIPLSASAPPTGEALSLNLAYINADGETVFEGGPFPIVAVPSVAGAPPPPPVSVPVQYTGPGSTATSVVITPHAQSVLSGDAFGFTATAFDASGAPMPGTPIVFTTSNAALAPLSSPSSGSGTAAVGRGAVTITAQLLTGPSDAATLTIQPRPSAIALVSGSGQTAQVNTLLSLPGIVRVTATDGLGVGGVTVAFTPSGDGAASPTSAVTAADGTAQANWTLGSVAGPQTLLATVSGLSGSPVTISATATPRPPAKLAFVLQPASVQVNSSIGTVTVAVLDASNNVTTTFNGPVTIGIGTNPGSATLLGTATVNAVGGVATFTGLSLTAIGNGYTLNATSGALSSATSAIFNILPGPATRVEFTTQPATAVAGVALAPVRVTVRDIAGNVATTYTGPVQISLSANPGGSALSGTATVNAVAGVATFSNLSLNKTGTNYTFIANATGLGSEVSAGFNITAGPPAVCTIASGNNQTAPASSTISVGIQVLDALGNSVPGAVVTGAVTSGGGSVSPASNIADAAGLATFAWTLGATVGSQSMSATCTGVAAAVSVGATATSAGPGPATQLAFTVQPATQTAGIAIAPSIQVTAKDAGNLTATSFVGNVTLAIGTNVGGATLGGTLTVAAVAGVATFPNIKLNKTGVGYTLTAASGVLTGATSNTFNINPAPAITMVKSAGDLQTATASTAVPTALAVTVTDSLGNGVPGVTINWLATTGGGSTSAATSVTNATGVATIGWTLGATPGAQTATATSGGLAGSPATFTATATAPGVTKTWNGSVSTAWTTAGNWTPSGVPIATDGVAIPVTGNSPVLSAPITLTNLTLAPTATLTNAGFSITLTGNLDAGTTIVGAGAVILNGTGTVMGAINSPVSVVGTYTVNGALNITGNISIDGGTLDVGANAVTVTGSLATTVGGTLKMTNAAGTMTVVGNADFSGGSESGKLTAGTFTLSGNLSSGGSAYNASGTNTLRFNGATSQTFTGITPTLQNADFAGAGGVVIPNGGGFNVIGNITIQPASGNITGHAQMFMGGSMTDPSGGAKWQVDTLGVGGCACVVSLPTNMHGLLIPMGNMTLGNNFTADSIKITSGAVNWNNKAVVVLGEFRTTGNGTLSMTQFAESLTVNGNASFGGFGSTFTNGWTIFKGNFTQTSAFSGSSFRAQPGHSTYFLGSANQTISFATPDTNAVSSCGASCFAFARISKTGGSFTFLTAAKVIGDLDIDPGVTTVDAIGAVGSPRYISMSGDIQNLSGVPAHFTHAGIGAGPSITPATVIDTIQFVGTVQGIGTGTFDYAIVTGTPVLVGTLTINSGLLIKGTGTLGINTKMLVDNGYLTTANTGRLVMTNASDTVLVGGAMTFGGGLTAPTAGTLIAMGDFAATGATFQASGTHTLVMLDTAAISGGHTLTYNAPVAGQGIRHLLFDGPGTTTLSGAVVPVMGDLNIGIGSAKVLGPSSLVRIGGDFNDSTFAVDTVGAWVVQNTEFFGSPTISADYLSTNIAITGGTARIPLFSGGGPLAGISAPAKQPVARGAVAGKSLLLARFMGSNFVQVNGSVTVNGASAVLDLNGNALYAWGDFTTSGGGKLNMTDPNDYFWIAGSAIWGGGSTAGMLTAGTMVVLADFTQSGGSADAFSADPGFETDVGVHVGGCDCAIRAGLKASKARAALLNNPKNAGARMQAASRSRQLASTRAAHRAQIDRRPARMAAFGIKMLPDSMIKPFRRAGATSTRPGIHLARTVVPSNLFFANPTSSGSHFGDFYVTGDALTLASDVWVAGELESGGSNHIVASANNLITSFGAANDDITFDNTRWSLLDGSPYNYSDFITFVNMDPTVDAFTVNRAGTITLYSWFFDAPPTTGHYINATGVALDMQFPYPATHGGFQLLQGGATSNWASVFEWTGAVSTAWDNGGNWTTGFAPGAFNDVTIPAGTPNSILLNTVGQVNNITFLTGATFDFGDYDFYVWGNLVTPLAAPVMTCADGGYLHLGGNGLAGGNTVTANLGAWCQLYVEADYKIAGPGSQLIVGASGYVRITGNLTINGGRLDIGDVGGVSGGSLYTQGSGTLTMQNSADLVFVGSDGSYFEGGSTTGLLTAGQFTVVNGCIHTFFGSGAPDAFAPSGAHKSIFFGTSNVEFGDANSFLNDAEIPSGQELVLYSDVTVKGTLFHGGPGLGIATLTSSDYLLTTSGIDQSGIGVPMVINNTRVLLVDGSATTNFDNVTWQGFAGGYTGDVLTVNRSAATTLTFTTHDFSAITLSTGHFLKNTGTSNVHMASPNPGTVTTQVLATGSGTIIWP